MNVVIIGPPGAGKGTQAQLLAAAAGFAHVSPGDLLRQAVRDGARLGREAKKFMDAGGLVPDDLVVELIGSRLREVGRGPGAVFDGFPRTLAQAKALDDVLAGLGQKLDVVVGMALPDEEAVRRLTGRRVCRGCGANYHLVYKPPATEGRCDLCGGELYQRSDDSEATARTRLEVYYRETNPLVQLYRSRGVLRDIDAQGDVGEVAGRLRRALGIDAE